MLASIHVENFEQLLGANGPICVHFTAKNCSYPLRRNWFALLQEAQIKAGRLPEGWDENPDRLRQKDLDARWTQKNYLSYYSYKNSICIYVDHGFIRRCAVTPANIHDSQMLPFLLDPENEHDYVWADSAYSGECFDALLSLGGFESLIHEKGARNHPLSDAAKWIKSSQVVNQSLCRACLWLHDHVHGWKADKKDWARKERSLVGPQEPDIQLPSFSQALCPRSSGCMSHS
jgi:hypothetical protein